MTIELKTKADRLAEKMSVFSVASITENGFPRVCCLTPLMRNGIDEFWFSTGTHSAKTRQFRENPKASVLIHDDQDSVTLLGEIDIVTDKILKDSLWRNSLEKHFPNGGKEDPEYCILHFKTDEATIYMNDCFVTIRV